MPTSRRPPNGTFFARTTRRGVSGFSLIEVMAAVAISSLVGAGVLTAALTQARTYVARRAEMDARLQAHTIFAALEEATYACGYGFGHAADHVGQAATGVCNSGDSYADGWASGAYVKTCSGVDTGGKSDRLRLSYIDPSAYTYLSPSAPSAGPCGSDASPPLPSLLHLAEAGVANRSGKTTLNGGTEVFVGGACKGAGAPSAATDALTLVGNAGPPLAQCREIRTFVKQGGSTLSCPDGFAPGFAMGPAESREFYSDTDPVSNLPRLMMAARVGGQPPAVVAVGVPRFEVTYGIDTSSALDGKMHACSDCVDPYAGGIFAQLSFCRDAVAAADGGKCVLRDDNNVVLNTQALQNRIVAVHVSFDLLAPQQTGAVSKSKGLPANTKTYTFSRLFRLPNMAS